MVITVFCRACGGRAEGDAQGHDKPHSVAAAHSDGCAFFAAIEHGESFARAWITEHGYPMGFEFVGYLA